MKHHKALWTQLPNAKRKTGNRRAGQRQQYKAQAKQFLAGQICAVFPWSGNRPRPATQVHHVRGRLGKLLLDQMYWLPVSAVGHRWIHDHPDEARRMGYLCAVGQWNKQA